MICPSVNLDRFIRPSFGRADSSYFWLSFRGHVTAKRPPADPKSYPPQKSKQNRMAGVVVVRRPATKLKKRIESARSPTYPLAILRDCVI